MCIQTVMTSLRAVVRYFHVKGPSRAESRLQSLVSKESLLESVGRLERELDGLQRNIRDDDRGRQLQ